MAAITTTSLQQARADRDRKLEDAQTVYSESVAEANAEFANHIRLELAKDETSVTSVASELGLSRQGVHDILRRFPA